MEELIHAAVENFLVPLLILIAGTVMILLQRAANRALNYLQLKGELVNMDTEADIRKKITDTLAIHVKAAVANMMSTAEEMKGGEKLTDEQIRYLNNNVYNLVMNSIPPSLIKEGNVLLETLGGKQVLDSIIKNLMEQYVYEYNHPKLTLEELAPVTDEVTADTENQ